MATKILFGNAEKYVTELRLCYGLVSDNSPKKSIFTCDRHFHVTTACVYMGHGGVVPLVLGWAGNWNRNA